jgi:hypothetical protein
MDLAASLTPEEREWLLTTHDVPPADDPCIPGLVAKGIVHLSLGTEPVIVPLGDAVMSYLR